MNRTEKIVYDKLVSEGHSVEKTTKILPDFIVDKKFFVEVKSSTSRYLNSKQKYEFSIIEDKEIFIYYVKGDKIEKIEKFEKIIPLPEQVVMINIKIPKNVHTESRINAFRLKETFEQFIIESIKKYNKEVKRNL